MTRKATTTRKRTTTKPTEEVEVKGHPLPWVVMLANKQERVQVGREATEDVAIAAAAKIGRHMKEDCVMVVVKGEG